MVSLRPLGDLWCPTNSWGVPHRVSRPLGRSLWGLQTFSIQSQAVLGVVSVGWGSPCNFQALSGVGVGFLSL